MERKEGKNQGWKEWIFKTSLPQLPLLCPTAGNGQSVTQPSCSPRKISRGVPGIAGGRAGCPASDHHRSCSEEDGPRLTSTDPARPTSCLLLRDPDLAFRRAVYCQVKKDRGCSAFVPSSRGVAHPLQTSRRSEQLRRLNRLWAAESVEEKECQHEPGDQEGACCVAWGDFSVIED